MSRESILGILGALVFISPWLGLPPVALEVLLAVLGFAVIAIAVTLRRRITEIALAARVPAEHAEVVEARTSRPYIS